MKSGNVTSTKYAKGKAEKKKNSKKNTSKAPIIRVKNVSMRYKSSSSNASGLKEFFIQRLKGKIKRKEIVALNDVSLDIYKGEVVGVIGTNGSGKSTLMKLIYGTLKPTDGEVSVNSKRVNLLTLGTGFDPELSARDNVYLNGAIIGYSKEYIDRHYKEIVDFAELDNFMNMKMKNFSTGMISRLAFSIATLGKASEILILDEILSVGDDYFRKKSLKRIKSMIHSGATVLLVSHSMSTIMENCTKVVWLDKGVVRMVGEPKAVCEKFRNKNANKVQAKPSGVVFADDKWVYMKNGVIDRSYTGLVSNDRGTWYIKEGELDWSYKGIVDYEGAKVCVINGRLAIDYTGLIYMDDTWHYISEGIVDNDYTGIADYKETKWFVVRGRLAKMSYVWRQDGYIYDIVDGKVNTSYYGIKEYDNKYWLFCAGVAEPDYCGLVFWDEQWWYINKGYFDDRFVGVVPYNERMWYIVNGRINKDYKGTVIYEDCEYYVKDGIATVVD